MNDILKLVGNQRNVPTLKIYHFTFDCFPEESSLLYFHLFKCSALFQQAEYFVCWDLQTWKLEYFLSLATSKMRRFNKIGFPRECPLFSLRKWKTTCIEWYQWLFNNHVTLERVGGHQFCDKALWIFEGRVGGLRQVLRNAIKSLLKR